MNINVKRAGLAEANLVSNVYALVGSNSRGGIGVTSKQGVGGGGGVVQPNVAQVRAGRQEAVSGAKGSRELNSLGSNGGRGNRSALSAGHDFTS